MSNNQERFKLIAKKGSKPRGLPRNKPSDAKQNLRDQVNCKKDRNMGLKRRLSCEGEVSNKKACAQTKIERVETSRNSTASKSQDGRNSATNRLARLREGLKETQSTSQFEHKALAKKVNNVTNLTRDHDTQVTSKYDHKNIVKKSSDFINQNIARTTKSDVKTSPPSSNFRIPIKKSANDRLKLAKECDTLSHKTENKTTVISKSPEKSTLNLKRRSSENANEKLYSPLEKSHYMESAPVRKTHFKYANTETPNSKTDTSFRLSNEYILISEVSTSESAGSSKHSTPANHRLTSIKNRLSSNSSDRTLTPGSPVNPVSPNKEESCFKTPVRPPNEIAGLKIPLNRGLFRRRTESAVQTERNIFRGVKDEEPVSISAEHSKSIFGAQVHPNIFQNYDSTTEKTDNIFTSNISRHNNNSIVIKINPEKNSQRSIFDATTSQKNIFSNFSNEERPVSGFPGTGLHNLRDTHQSVYPSESKKSEICTEKRQTLPQNLKPSPNSRKSATDRLTRIKNEGCNTYRKNEVSALHERVEENQGCCQLMELEPIIGRSSENPMRTMVRIQEFEDTLQHHDIPNKLQTCSKKHLTQDWLDTHERNNKNLETTMSDSMVVNVDDTILNKSELADPIEDVSMDWDSVPQPSDISPVTPPAPPVPKKENIICVVTDTNVFMHFLYKIKDVINFKVSGSQKIKIYVPWMVLKELDHFKDHSGEPIRSIALEAQRFINKNLTEQDSKIIGQSVQEVSHQQDIGKCPDDKILACSMQAQEKYETVILLTNDINLRNAASFNDIQTCTPQEIISRLKLVSSKRSKFCKIRTKLVTLWSEIICDCCTEAYGDAWKKMDMLQNPPWSMVECVKRFKRYWGSVFRVVLLKHCQQPLDGIYSFLMKYKDCVEDDTDEFKEFTKLVLGFLFFLQDLPNHKNSVKRVLKEIEDIIESG